MATPVLPDIDGIREILRQVVDPELGANIVDLGLIYRIEPTPERVLIEMTMTSPACPMGDMIMEDVNSTLAAALPENCRPEVRLVWEPPWDPSMMSERVKAHFGW
jgi:metal-sulfur cluster biosynthetic enzyme